MGDCILWEFHLNLKNIYGEGMGKSRDFTFAVA